MAKIDKWDMLKKEMKRLADEFDSILNSTAEEYGMCQAYNYVYTRMCALEVSQKRIDRA